MASTVARTSKRGGWFLLFFHRCFVVYLLPLLHYDWLRLQLAFTSAIAWVLVYSGRGVFFLAVLTMTLPAANQTALLLQLLAGGHVAVCFVSRVENVLISVCCELIKR